MSSASFSARRALVVTELVEVKADVGLPLVFGIRLLVRRKETVAEVTQVVMVGLEFFRRRVATGEATSDALRGVAFARISARWSVNDKKEAASDSIHCKEIMEVLKVLAIDICASDAAGNVLDYKVRCHEFEAPT